MDEIIRINNLSKKFNSTQIFESLLLDIKKDCFVSLLGPSACGKSTLLKLIAGIDKEYSGEILRAFEIADINLVFQKPIFLHWLNIRQNLQLIGKLDNKILSDDFISKILKTVGLSGIELLYPKEISGGMKARVSIARALICEPKIILFDEPFNGLDFMTKSKIMELFNDLLINKVNVIMTTHNIDDALLLSNRVIMFSNKPTEIIDDFYIDLPFPRKKDDLFIRTVNEIESKFKKHLK